MLRDLLAACLMVSLGWIPVACGPRAEPNSAVKATASAASETRRESGDRGSFYIAVEGRFGEPRRGQRGRGDSINLNPPLTKDTKVYARVHSDNGNGIWDDDSTDEQVLYNGDELVIALVLKIKQR